MRERCPQVIARDHTHDHAHDEAIGTVDESGMTKNGNATAAVARQYNGNRGKIENCPYRNYTQPTLPASACR